MQIHPILAGILAKRDELSGVSRPVIEAVIREALYGLSFIVADNTTLEQLLDEEWGKCESCDVVFRNGDEGKLEVGEDGVPVCNNCLAEHTE